MGRVGMKEYEKYLKDLHASYPDYWVRTGALGAFGTHRLCKYAWKHGAPPATLPQGADMLLLAR